MIKGLRDRINQKKMGTTSSEIEPVVVKENIQQPANNNDINLSSEERDEMSRIFSEKLASEKKRLMDEVNNLEMETNARIRLITKEYQSRIDLVKNESEQTKRDLKDRFGVAIERFEKLMFKLNGSRTMVVEDELIPEPTVEPVAVMEPEQLNPPEPQPVTSEDKQLKAEVDKFLKELSEGKIK